MSDTSDRGPTAGPTREERQRLVQLYQAWALRQPDLLAANLGVLAGDLLFVTHAVGERVRAAAAGGDARFDQAADVYLKFVRQIDRLAHLERQAGGGRPRPPAGGAAGEEPQI